MAEHTERIATIRNALKAGLSAQGVFVSDAIDLDQLASAVAGALGQAPSPLDPEGDGLQPDEINATNDV